MRIDQDSIEIIDANRKSTVVSENSFGSNRTEKTYKRRRTIGYEQTDIRGSRDDFKKNFDSIFKDR